MRALGTFARFLACVVMVLTAACGATAVQDELTTESNAPSASAVPTASKVPGLPVRPRNVPLDGIDPCALLSVEQRSQFELDRPPLPDTQPSEGNAPTCDFNNSKASIGVVLISSTANGVGVWLDGTRGGTVTPLMVAGFPAMQIVEERQDIPLCLVAVDVADGQQLIAQDSPSFSDPASLEQRCADAAMYAEAAMETLVTR